MEFNNSSIIYTKVHSLNQWDAELWFNSYSSTNCIFECPKIIDITLLLTDFLIHKHFNIKFVLRLTEIHNLKVFYANKNNYINQIKVLKMSYM